MSSNQPFYNENFYFTFNERPKVLFDKIVNFEIFNAKGGLNPSSLIGSFSCDVGTFYFEKDHAVLKKWLLMTGPEDGDEEEEVTLGQLGAPAGFLQVNAIVLGPGDEIPERAKVDVDVDDVEDIESNLLLPTGKLMLFF